MNHEAVGRHTRGERTSLADAGIQKRTGEYTDRFLVLLDPQAVDEGMAALRSRAGVARAEHVPGAETAGMAEIVEQAGAMVFDELGVGVVEAAPDQRDMLVRAGQEESAILATEWERVVYASQLTVTEAGVATADYLRGYHDGVEELVTHALERLDRTTRTEARAVATDESQATWGLQAVRVPESAFSGKGVKVAVLDTGVDLTHPDFVGRFGGTSSFVPGQAVEDGHGHGTHCIGTSCGPRTPRVLPRYGVAFESEIFAGKVLSDQGSGTDAQILAGINWAVSQDCRVVSMSLGAATLPGEPFSQVYEHAARRALRSGTLIVAAAGNESDRPDTVRPVGHPANCPSILAVAALDSEFTVGFFSNAGLNPEGGQIDIAAPGVDVLSAWPGPTGHRRLMGTSMATPHVAGVAALLAQANPGATAAELKSLLLAGARRLPVPAVDVGAGLAQAT
jgi:subtilisin family serine protease